MRRNRASPAAARRHRKVLARAYRARLLSPSPSPRSAESSPAGRVSRLQPKAKLSASPAADVGDDARVANLMKRFDGVNSDEVREALESANGHAGRAATKLRTVLDLAQRGGARGRVDHQSASARQEDRAPAAAAATPCGGTSGGGGKQGGWAAPSPRCAVQLTTGKPLALRRVGTAEEAMVLVRKVRTLCDCGHGTIQEVVSRSGQRFALKTTEREGRHWTDAVREAKAMTALNGHPLLVELVATRKDPSQMYALLELCTGGDLCTRLAEIERLSEGATKFYGAQVSRALQFLHTPRSNPKEGFPSVHYIHRDIKPDNIFIGENGYIKLGDFGFAVPLQHDERRHTRCGTSEYMAPEVVRHGSYGRSADYWSLGVVLYECLFGATPFADFDDDSVYKKILKFNSEVDLAWAHSEPSPRSKRHLSKIKGFGLPKARMLASEGGLLEQPATPLAASDGGSRTSTYGGSTSEPITSACRDFITKLMTVDIEHRLGMGKHGVAELVEHQWFARGFDWDKLDAQKLEAPWIPPRVLDGMEHF
jgi:serine/threonine protein kinase